MHKNIKFFGIIIFFNDLRTKEPPQIFLTREIFDAVHTSVNSQECNGGHD